MRRFFIISAIFLMAAALSAAARAEVGAVKVSTTEDVVIAFYKTGGAMPNFEKWITQRDPYKTTPLARRPAMMESELARLKKIYAEFDPQSSLMTLKTSVVARAAEYQDPKDPEKTLARLEMHFESAKDADYFPYDFLGERFALIPKDIATHLKPAILPEQFDYLNGQLGENGKPVTMILELRAAKADMNAPFNLDGTGGGVDAEDGKGQWMFLTDVASISIWNRTGTLLWEYTAPWYITPMRKDLLNLYTDKQ